MVIVSNGAILALVLRSPLRLRLRLHLCSTNSSHSADLDLRRIVSAAAGAVAGAVLAPIVAPITLGLFGFSATGVVAGKFPSQADQLAG